VRLEHGKQQQRKLQQIAYLFATGN